MKGLSPFIASVLLIAFVLAVAAVFSGWYTSFVKETTEDVETHSKKRVTCVHGGIALNNIKFNSTEVNMTGEVENTDVIDLGSITIELFYDNATRVENDLSMTLKPGERDTFNIASNSNYETIRVYTNCSDVSDEITSSDVSTIT